jgi:hypothetical protein
LSQFEVREALGELPVHRPMRQSDMEPHDVSDLTDILVALHVGRGNGDDFPASRHLGNLDMVVTVAHVLC